MYLIQGAPTEILDTDCDHLLQPVQIWKYFYIPTLGHEVRFLFYKPRHSNDYKLWQPGILSGQNDALADLVSEEAMAGAVTAQSGVQQAFFHSASPYTPIHPLHTDAN